MSEFDYIAKDDQGRIVKGCVAAESQYSAFDQIVEKRMTIISLSASRQNRQSAPGAGAKAQTKRPRKLKAARLSSDDMAVFCRQLAVLINSSIPIINALDSLAQDTETPSLQTIVRDLIAQINSGKNLSQALAEHKKTFSYVFISLVRAAEESGNMAKTLDYIANYIETSERIKRKVNSITAYPVFVIFFMIIVVLVVNFFLLPRFSQIFDQFQADLPQLTRTVFGINKFFIAQAPFIVLGLIAISLGLYFGCKNPNMRYKVHGFILKLPLVGVLCLKSIIARFCRTLALLLRGGVSIGIALDISSKVCGNKVIEDSLNKVRGKILSGSDITGGLEEDKIFPRMMVRLVGAGESSGRLPEVLEKVAEIYEDVVEKTITTIMTLFEPIVICLFGAVVLILILSIYVPVFKIATSMV